MKERKEEKRHTEIFKLMVKMTAAAAAAAMTVMCAIMCVQMCAQKSTKRELPFQSFDCRTRCHLSDEGGKIKVK